MQLQLGCCLHFCGEKSLTDGFKWWLVFMGNMCASVRAARPCKDLILKETVS